MAAAITACGGLPAEGPPVSAISDTDPDSGAAAPYIVVKIDEKVANIAGEFHEPGFASFHAVGGAQPALKLERGDRVSINIFEAGADGLFSSSEVKSAEISSVIDQSGRIFVPYVGPIQVSGRSVESVRAEIQRELEDKAIQPQVQVFVTGSTANTATVLGVVNEPGQVPILTSGLRVLDLVANAGGTSVPTYRTQVMLRRGNQVATANLEDIFDRPTENVPIRPGDTILLSDVTETFTVLGAATQQSEVPFETRRVTLAQALGRAEGLDGEIADARGIFLFRFEPDHVAKSLSERAITAPEGSRVPVIYRLNLQNPNSLFLAQMFEMRDEDVLFIADHPSAQFAKFLRIISPAVTTANTIITVGTRVGR